jgi:hypothetical protein
MNLMTCLRLIWLEIMFFQLAMKYLGVWILASFGAGVIAGGVFKWK